MPSNENSFTGSASSINSSSTSLNSSSSINLKRKLTDFEDSSSQMNFSTYYFKHSDEMEKDNKATEKDKMPTQVQTEILEQSQGNEENPVENLSSISQSRDDQLLP